MYIFYGKTMYLSLRTCFVINVVISAIYTVLKSHLFVDVCSLYCFSIGHSLFYCVKASILIDGCLDATSGSTYPKYVKQKKQKIKGPDLFNLCQSFS